MMLLRHLFHQLKKNIRFILFKKIVLVQFKIKKIAVNFKRKSF